jgi:hypothetical protein
MNFKSKEIWAHKTHDLFLKFSSTKIHTSPLRCSQKTEFFSTLNLSEWPPRSTWFFTINPHTEEDNTYFPELNNKFDSFRTTPSHLGDKSPKVINTNKIVDEDEQSALAQVSDSLKDLLQSSLKCSRIKRDLEWEEWAQNVKRISFFNCWSGQPK